MIQIFIYFVYNMVVIFYNRFKNITIHISVRNIAYNYNMAAFILH